MEPASQTDATMRAAVFLDRDGVLCENRPTYVKAWSEFQWIPGAQQALRALATLEIPVVMVTNQSAINRGLTTMERVGELHRQLQREVRQADGRLDAVYVCPHRPDEGCQCRKPSPLLFFRAADDLGLDLARSYLIGDSLSDLRAGWNLNMHVILVRTGLGVETATQLERLPVPVVRDVLDAVHWIQTDVALRGTGARSTGADRASSPGRRGWLRAMPVDEQGSEGA